METVVLIIFCMVGLNFMLRLTFHGWAGRTVLCLVAAVFVLFTTGLATTQSKTQIADWLSQPELMLDASVWLTIDVAFQISFCVITARRLTGQTGIRERLAGKVCMWFPGLLIFPVLFALQTALIFSLPGADFSLIGRCLAVGVVLAVPLLAAGCKYMLPESDIRLELMFMLNLLIAALGVVATVNGRTAAAGTNEIGWAAFAGVVCLLLVGFAAGFLLRKYHLTKQIKKIR